MKFIFNVAALFILQKVLFVESDFVQKRTLLSNEVLLFIRGTSGEMGSIELPSDGDANQLYQEAVVKGVLLSGQSLSFGGTLINVDATPLADLGIGAEGVLHAGAEPSFLESLYHLVVHSAFTKNINWWGLAEHCHQDPSNQECNPQNVCRRFQSIGCDDDALIRRLDLDVRWKKSPNLNFLPHSLVTLSLNRDAYSDMPWALHSIDLRGLRGKSLTDLSIEWHLIDNIDLSQLHGTLLQTLSLGYNQIRNIDFSGLKATMNSNVMEGTSLESLYLEWNELHSVDMTGIEHSQLVNLSVGDNPMERMNFAGVHRSLLKNLNFGFDYFKQFDLWPKFINIADYEQSTVNTENEDHRLEKKKQMEYLKSWARRVYKWYNWPQ